MMDEQVKQLMDTIDSEEKQLEELKEPIKKASEGVVIGKAETIEQFKELIEANEKGLFKIGPRSNRRKTTRGRRTQIIKVPKYLINPELDEKTTKIVKNMMKGKENLKPNYDHEIDGKKTFIKNKSPFAGKTKYIYHYTI